MFNAVYFDGNGIGEIISQFNEAASDNFLEQPKDWINKLYWGGDPMEKEESPE